MKVNQTIKILVGIFFFLLHTILRGQEKSQMTMGNGENNFILLDDVKRNGSTLSFSKVSIEGNGWLVIHPFEDGKPNGDQQSAMNDQITKLFGPAATRIGQIELCRNVSGYGVYEPFESTTFLAGVEQPLILYVELENFNSLFDGQQYRVRLSQEVALYTDADGLRVWHLPREEIVDVSRKKRRDFFTVQLLQLPARLGVGKYRLKVRIHDINARSFDELTVPINLVASQNTTAKNDDAKSGNLRSN